MLKIANKTFDSRLLLGTGKYPSFERGSKKSCGSNQKRKF